MKKIILVVLIVASFFACEKIKTSAVCGSYDVAMRYVADGEKLSVRINGERVLLDLVPSASGAKYDGVLKNGDKLTLWGKGDNWTMLISDGQAIVCE